MHRGHEFNGAPMRLFIGGISSMRAHSQGPSAQWGPNELMHRGQEFNEALVRPAIRSMRPQCAYVHGPWVQ